MAIYSIDVHSRGEAKKVEDKDTGGANHSHGL